MTRFTVETASPKPKKWRFIIEDIDEPIPTPSPTKKPRTPIIEDVDEPNPEPTEPASETEESPAPETQDEDYKETPKATAKPIRGTKAYIHGLKQKDRRDMTRQELDDIYANDDHENRLANLQEELKEFEETFKEFSPEEREYLTEKRGRDEKTMATVIKSIPRLNSIKGVKITRYWTPNVIYKPNTRYHVSHGYGKKRIELLASGTDTGKTFAGIKFFMDNFKDDILKHAKENDFIPCLYLISRRSMIEFLVKFNKALDEKFGEGVYRMVSYLDDNEVDFNPEANNSKDATIVGVLCSPESLHKITRRGASVVMTCEAISLSDQIFSPLHKAEQDSRDVLLNMLASAKYIRMADGFMDYRLVEFFSSMLEDGEKIHLGLNTFSKFKELGYEFYDVGGKKDTKSEKEAVTFSMIAKMLSMGEKIAVAITQIKTVGERLINHIQKCEAFSKWTVATEANDMTSEIVYYNKDTTSLKPHFRNFQEAVKFRRLILFTNTCGVGLDNSEEDERYQVDRLFVFSSSGSANVRIMHQMLDRHRTLKKRKIYFCHNDIAKDCPYTSVESARNWINNEHKKQYTLAFNELRKGEKKEANELYNAVKLNSRWTTPETGNRVMRLKEDAMTNLQLAGMVENAIDHSYFRIKHDILSLRRGIKIVTLNIPKVTRLTKKKIAEEKEELRDAYPSDDESEIEEKVEKYVIRIKKKNEHAKNIKKNIDQIRKENAEFKEETDARILALGDTIPKLNITTPQGEATKLALERKIQHETATPEELHTIKMAIACSYHTNKSIAESNSENPPEVTFNGKFLLKLQKPRAISNIDVMHRFYNKEETNMAKKFYQADEVKPIIHGHKFSVLVAARDLLIRLGFLEDCKVDRDDIAGNEITTQQIYDQRGWLYKAMDNYMAFFSERRVKTKWATGNVKGPLAQMDKLFGVIGLKLVKGAKPIYQKPILGLDGKPERDMKKVAAFASLGREALAIAKSNGECDCGIIKHYKYNIEWIDEYVEFSVKNRRLPIKIHTQGNTIPRKPTDTDTKRAPRETKEPTQAEMEKNVRQFKANCKKKPQLPKKVKIDVSKFDGSCDGSCEGAASNYCSHSEDDMKIPGTYNVPDDDAPDSSDDE